MRNAIIAALFIAGGHAAAADVHAQATSSRATPAPLVRLRAGMIITQSVRIAPGTYLLPASATDSGVIRVRGNDITIDFNGAILRGIPAGADPDRAAGVGVRIDGGRNVRVTN